ncbi:MAG: hypothetical protein GY807_24030 [Gammaproteobacteria bacterium]|nr:hypothetical protein [Gammaproteobacteria bacterium]
MTRFDVEYAFDELPLLIGNGVYAKFTGTACLEQDIGETFVITGIDLEGYSNDKYEQGTIAKINPRHDSAKARLLFELVSILLYESADCQEFFAEQLALSMWEAA